MSLTTSVFSYIASYYEELQRLGHKMTGGAKSNNSTTTTTKRRDTTQQNGETVRLPSETGPKHASKKQQEPPATEEDLLAKRLQQQERERLVLWRRPINTVFYALLELRIVLVSFCKKVLAHKYYLFGAILSVLSLYALMLIDGPFQSPVKRYYKKLLWCLYWIGLGVLSSVGLGTGLHTFLLYLGPFIAKVTIAAYSCNSVNFPEPPYPDDIVCPDDDVTSKVTMFDIIAKVRLEAMCWGAGTALGELPPYFMAKAARLSGIDPDDAEDLAEFEELQKKEISGAPLTIIEKGKLFTEKLVRKVGFFGILACASIPNPLFDLAGITCGHFLVPFWSFFGATLIGKAIIKMHIQKLAVILAFDEEVRKWVVEYSAMVPVIGNKLQYWLQLAITSQQFYHTGEKKPETVARTNYVSYALDWIVFSMVLYFVVSIVNSFAQNYHRRINKSKKSKRSD